MAGFDLDMNATDPEALAGIFNQIESGELPNDPPVETPPEPQAEAPVRKEPDAVVVPAAVKEGQADPEPEGVATKDGKHVIPYSVLQGVRDRAARAEQLAKDAADRIAELEAQVKSGNQEANQGDHARTNPPTTDADELSTDDLEALKEDFPTVYKAIMSAQATARALEARLNPVVDTIQQGVDARARTEQEVVQDAIDSVPKMAHIQASDPATWKLAKDLDAALRTQDHWQGKPLSERFAKVIELVEMSSGAIKLAVPPPPPPTTEETRKAAQALAAKGAKASRTDVPTSLSDFPSGLPAATDEAEAATSMTAQQLADKFTAMSPEAMDAYLQSL